MLAKTILGNGSQEHMFIGLTDETECSGEIRLAVAVLAVALVDLKSEGCTRRETIDWFLSDERGWPYSFLGICEILSLDAEAVRAVILAERSIGAFPAGVK